MARTVAIWISGLVVCAVVGGVLGRQFMGSGADLIGAVVGLFAFTCVRLWTVERGG